MTLSIDRRPIRHANRSIPETVAVDTAKFGKMCHIGTMEKTKAIEILSAHFGAEYLGTYTVPACSGNLIQDIMNEGNEGKVLHQWATAPLKTTVAEDSLVGLARHYA